MPETSLYLAGQRLAGQHDSPLIYARDVSEKLRDKLEQYVEQRIEIAASLTSEIAILRMLSGRALAAYEAACALSDDVIDKQTKVYTAYYHLNESLERVKNFCRAAAQIQRDLTKQTRDDVFMLGALTQTMASLVQRGELSDYAANMIEETIQPVNAHTNNGLVSPLPTRITADQIVTAMDNTIPYVPQAQAKVG